MRVLETTFGLTYRTINNQFSPAETHKATINMNIVVIFVSLLMVWTKFNGHDNNAIRVDLQQGAGCVCHLRCKLVVDLRVAKGVERTIVHSFLVEDEEMPMDLITK